MKFLTLTKKGEKQSKKLDLQVYFPNRKNRKNWLEKSIFPIFRKIDLIDFFDSIPSPSQNLAFQTYISKGESKLLLTEYLSQFLISHEVFVQSCANKMLSNYSDGCHKSIIIITALWFHGVEKSMKNGKKNPIFSDQLYPRDHENAQMKIFPVYPVEKFLLFKFILKKALVLT